MSDNKYLTILIEWLLPDGCLYLQEWTDAIVNGEQAAVKKAIEYLTSVERLEGKKIRSVRAVDKSKFDTYIIEQLDQPLYMVRGIR